MKLERFLVLLGEETLRSAAPEGPMVVAEINKYSKLTHVIDGLTGHQALELIGTLDVYHARKLLAMELNDGLDVRKEQKERQARLEKNRSGKYIKPLMALGASFLVAVTTLSWVVMTLWATYHTKELPSWEQMFLPYVIPGVILWQYFGIINTETKALVESVVGSTPVGNAALGLIDAVRNRKRGNRVSDHYVGDHEPAPPRPGRPSPPAAPGGDYE